MKYFGAHVSASGGVENAPANARRIGATAFALFTKNQRQWSAAPLAAPQIEAFRRACAEGGYAPAQILPHDTYLINLGHPDAEALEKIARGLRRGDAALRAAGARPPQLPPGQPPAADLRGGLARPHRRVDQPGAGGHARRHGRHREHGRTGLQPRLPLRAPRLPDRPRGGQVARGRLHRHLPRLRRRLRPAERGRPAPRPSPSSTARWASPTCGACTSTTP